MSNNDVSHGRDRYACPEFISVPSLRAVPLSPARPPAACVRVFIHFSASNLLRDGRSETVRGVSRRRGFCRRRINDRPSVIRRRLGPAATAALQLLLLLPL